ncbi:Vesicle transport v-SNARE 11 [Vigna angularis]|uniref:Vesicle transport v-SNARE 11 n=1 Tax=Phaseolus angularis TaxID=3914 RepID=A0A8T0KJ58_PHAAN|nr:Vesicle transport v-SNARE 11 [Vigna angularis]
MVERKIGKLNGYGKSKHPSPDVEMRFCYGKSAMNLVAQVARNFPEKNIGFKEHVRNVNPVIHGKCVNTHKFGEAQRTLVDPSSSLRCFLRLLSSDQSPAIFRSISGNSPVNILKTSDRSSLLLLLLFLILVLDLIDSNWEGRVEKLGTMSQVFDGYERQYCELSANLSRQCTGASSLDGEQKKQKISDIKAGLDDAETLIRKMDLEARSLQPSMKTTLLAKLREYKTDLTNLKTEVKRVTTSNVSFAARDDLLESGSADTLAVSLLYIPSSDIETYLWMLGQVSNDQKGRLLMSTERLNQSSDRIKDSRKTMLETEELGVSILQDLHLQRQSLLHAHKTLNGVDDNISKSKKILSAMSRRMSRNRWIVGSLLTAMVVAVIIILYFSNGSH